MLHSHSVRSTTSSDFGSAPLNLARINIATPSKVNGHHVGLNPSAKNSATSPFTSSPSSLLLRLSSRVAWTIPAMSPPDNIGAAARATFVNAPLNPFTAPNQTHAAHHDRAHAPATHREHHDERPRQRSRGSDRVRGERVREVDDAVEEQRPGHASRGAVSVRQIRKQKRGEEQYGDAHDAAEDTDVDRAEPQAAVLASRRHPDRRELRAGEDRERARDLIDHREFDRAILVPRRRLRCARLGLGAVVLGLRDDRRRRVRGVRVGQFPVHSHHRDGALARGRSRAIARADVRQQPLAVFLLRRAPLLPRTRARRRRGHLNLRALALSAAATAAAAFDVDANLSLPISALVVYPIVPPARRAVFTRALPGDAQVRERERPEHRPRDEHPRARQKKRVVAKVRRRALVLVEQPRVGVGRRSIFHDTATAAARVREQRAQRRRDRASQAVGYPERAEGARGVGPVAEGRSIRAIVGVEFKGVRWS
eukprot:30981-Pelagococcus_subviridis.AAC.4